jgi:hypothetical protein
MDTQGERLDSTDLIERERERRERGRERERERECVCGGINV